MQRLFNVKAILLILLLVSGLCFGDVKIINNTSKSKNKPEKKKEYLVKNLPQEAEKVEVEGKPYFRKNGIYYIEGKTGYKIVRPPYGMKVKHLPNGVRIIRHHDTNYYYYYNTYYSYDARQDIYIVVKTPDWAYEDYKDDKLSLMNGSVLIGKYLGGNSDEVYFLFNGEKNRYPVEEVISIEFAPADIWEE